jgi:hypothetical protein
MKEPSRTTELRVDTQDRENLLIETPAVTMARTRHLLARSRATLDAVSRRLATAGE